MIMGYVKKHQNGNWDGTIETLPVFKCFMCKVYKSMWSFDCTIIVIILTFLTPVLQTSLGTF